MTARRRSRPQSIGKVVDQVLGDLGLEHARAALRIGELWEQAVGAEVARHCRPVAVRGPVLEAEVDSSVWCQQLSLRRDEILLALRGVLGEKAPSELRFRVGYTRGPESRRPAAGHKARRDQRDQREIAREDGTRAGLERPE